MPTQTLVRLLSLTALLLPGPALADLAVSGRDALYKALAEAPSGETLVLAGGDYADLVLIPKTRANAPITLRSADPHNPARFSTLAMSGTADVTLDGVIFDYTFAKGDALWLTPFSIAGSQRITLRNAIFDGDVARGASKVDDGYGTGFGLSIEGSSAVTVSGCRFHDFMRGIVVSDSDHVAIVGNELSSIRSDGMDFVADQSVLVAGNTLHDFRSAPLSEDHPDMIQFWTAGATRPSTDIEIRDNVLNSGHGDFTQSIFMGNEMVNTGQAGREMFYRNVKITGNVIVNSHLHGITIAHADGVTIMRNTLIHNRLTDGPEDNPPLWTPRINVSDTSDRVTIKDNLTPSISGPEARPDWAVSGNLFIQDTDPSAPLYYDSIFFAALTGDPGDLSSFAYLPGGPADGKGVGASMLDRRAGNIPAASPIRAERDRKLLNRFTFEAGGTQGVDPAWDFGDGTTAQGARVTHDFAPGRVYAVTLLQKDAKGATVRSKARIAVPGPDLARFDQNSGTIMVMGKAGMEPLPPSQSVQGRAISLGQGNPPVTIPADRLKGLSGAEDFQMTLAVQVAPRADAAGTILQLGGVMTLGWFPARGFGLRFETAEIRPISVWTGPVAMDAGGPKVLTVRYDGASGSLFLEVDGALAAKGRSRGKVVLDGTGLVFGDAGGGKSLDGAVSSFELKARLGNYAPVP